MADEIKLTIKATLANVDLKDEFNPGQVSIDQAAQGIAAATFEISNAADTPIPLDAIVGNEGIVLLRNLDDTNYVDIGPADEYGVIVESMLRVKPGEPAAFRLVPSVSLSARANTAPVLLQVKAWRN